MRCSLSFFGGSKQNFNHYNYGKQMQTCRVNIKSKGDCLKLHITYTYVCNKFCYALLICKKKTIKIKLIKSMCGKPMESTSDDVVKIIIRR